MWIDQLSVVRVERVGKQRHFQLSDLEIHVFMSGNIEDTINHPLLSTKFHVSCLCGNLEVVGELLKSSEQVVTQKDKFGRDGFMYAAMGGKVEIAQLLLAHGASASIIAKNGYTALHYAASWGHINLCKWLVLDLGADIAATDRFGHTPLHVATLQGRLDVSLFLLRTLLTTPTTTHNKMNSLLPVSLTGDTPFHMAACGGHVTVFIGLLHELCSVDSSAAPSVANQPNHVGKTPLHVAVSIDCLDMVKCIVNAGAEVDHITADGRSALDMAKACGHADIEAFLSLPYEDMRTAAAAVPTADKPTPFTPQNTPQSTPETTPDSPPPRPSRLLIPTSTGQGIATKDRGGHDMVSAGGMTPEGDHVRAMTPEERGTEDSAHTTAMNIARMLQRMDSGGRKKLLALSLQQQEQLPLPPHQRQRGHSSPAPLPPPSSLTLLIDDLEVTSPRIRPARRVSGDSPRGRPSPRALSSLMASQLSAGGLQARPMTGSMLPSIGSNKLIPARRTGPEVSRQGGAKALPRRYTFNDFEDTDDNSMTTDGYESGPVSRRQSADSSEDMW